MTIESYYNNNGGLSIRAPDRGCGKIIARGHGDFIKCGEFLVYSGQEEQEFCRYCLEEMLIYVLSGGGIDA